MDAFTLSQILAAFAICFDVLSFQFKQRRKILICLCLSAILISSHFFLLDQWTASAMMSLAAVRYFLSIFTTSKKLASLFLAIIIIIFCVSYSGVLSILSCAGSFLGTIAAFTARDLILRRIMILGTLCWVVHNIILGSPVAIILEMLFLGSNLIGYYRYYLSPHSQKGTV